MLAPWVARTTTACTAVALQRCDRFVGRTMNWLYDHLRLLHRHQPLIIADQLHNRTEFPQLTAWQVKHYALPRRVWRRLSGKELFPPDVWRIQSQAPRVLHSHFGYVAAQDESLARALEVPWLVGFYGADVYEIGKDPVWQERYAQIFPQIAAVLPLGPAMREQLILLGCPREKIVVHPLGVEVDALPWRVRERTSGEPLRILFAGTFREKKGVTYLLEAVAIARRKKVPLRLELVGDEADKPGDRETKLEILTAISRWGLESCTTHRPFLPFADLMRLALDCHLFAAPSVTAANGDSEGTPFVLQQMMATAMPAISTVHSDIPYIFGSMKSMLVPERDASALADRICHYADSPDALARDGLALRDQIRACFDARDCAGRLDAIYDKAVKGAGFMGNSSLT